MHPGFQTTGGRAIEKKLSFRTDPTYPFSPFHLLSARNARVPPQSNSVALVH